MASGPTPRRNRSRTIRLRQRPTHPRARPTFGIFWRNGSRLESTRRWPVISTVRVLYDLTLWSTASRFHPRFSELLSAEAMAWSLTQIWSMRGQVPVSWPIRKWLSFSSLDKGFWELRFRPRSIMLLSRARSKKLPAATVTTIVIGCCENPEGYCLVGLPRGV